MRYILLLENEKGKRYWMESSDLSIWRNPTVGKWIFVENKQWQVKAIIPQFFQTFETDL